MTPSSEEPTAGNEQPPDRAEVPTHPNQTDLPRKAMSGAHRGLWLFVTIPTSLFSALLLAGGGWVTAPVVLLFYLGLVYMSMEMGAFGRVRNRGVRIFLITVMIVGTGFVSVAVVLLLLYLLLLAVCGRS